MELLGKSRIAVLASLVTSVACERNDVTVATEIGSAGAAGNAVSSTVGGRMGGGGAAGTAQPPTVGGRTPATTKVTSASGAAPTSVAGSTAMASGGAAPSNGGAAGSLVGGATVTKGGTPGSAGSATVATGGTAGSAGSATVAMGGTAGTSGSATAGSTAVAPADCSGLDGSYEISVTDTTYPLKAIVLSATLVDTSNGCRATVTPQYYPAVTMTPDITPSGVVLDDSKGKNQPILMIGSYSGKSTYREFQIKRITLQRSGSGALTGVADALIDDYSGSDDISRLDPDRPYSGTVVADNTAPLLRAGGQSVIAPQRSAIKTISPYFPSAGSLARLGLPQQILPWETIAIEASEPVFNLVEKVQIDPAIAVEFAEAAIADNVLATDVWLWSHFLDWDAVRGTTQPIRVDTTAADLAGNLVTQNEISVSVLDVGPVVASHEFDGANKVGFFGNVTVDSGVATITNACGAGIGGVAGRIATTGKTKLVVLMNKRDKGSVIVRAVGASRSEYSAVAAEWTTDLRIEVPIANEPEVGFSVVPNVICHTASSSTAVVDRVFAE